jgi:hypothetical protein
VVNQPQAIGRDNNENMCNVSGMKCSITLSGNGLRNGFRTVHKQLVAYEGFDLLDEPIFDVGFNEVAVGI